MEELLPLEQYEMQWDRASRGINRSFSRLSGIVIALAAGLTSLLKGGFVAGITFALAGFGVGYFLMRFVFRPADRFKDSMRSWYEGGATLVDESFEDRFRYRILCYQILAKRPVSGVLFLDGTLGAAFVPIRQGGSPKTAVTFALDHATLETELLEGERGKIARTLGDRAGLTFRSPVGAWTFLPPDPAIAERRIREVLPAHFT